MIDRRTWLSGAGAAAVLFGRSIARAEASSGTIPATSPTVEQLVRRPELRGASISPDGKQLAVLGRKKAGDKTSTYLALSALPISAAGRKINLEDLDVTGIGWAKNDRLLVSLNVWKDARGRPSGIDFGGVFIPVPSRRVMAIDPSGQNVVGLFSDETKLLRGSFDGAHFVDALPDDPRRIMMRIWDQGRSVMSLHYVDVYTGESTLIERGTAQTDSWITQNGVPILRQDSTVGGASVTIFARTPGEADWKVIRKSRRDVYRRLPDFDVVGGTPQAGVILLSARLEGENTKCIREFDLRTLQFGKVVASHPKYDLDDVLVGPDLKYQAASYFEDRLMYDCVDQQLARHLRGINTYFENRCNVWVAEQSRDGSSLLLRVSGPTEPGSFYVYDLKSRKLDEIGATRPWLAADNLAVTQAFTVKARDGAEFACYLTIPRKTLTGALPMVVMPHGGPELRDHLDFDPFAQALAAQGWLVLQPNFRGSGGYGRAFADQGRKHWGDRMQEDVEDAVAQVIASGRADPKRLAIMGFSYGGYAALMGAVLRPDLYRAVVAGAADADLFELLKFAKREEGSDSPTYAYWRSSVGDPKADEAILKAGSPAQRAAEIKAPVLLIHGTEDEVVTPRQSTLMIKALKAEKKTYEFIELKGEGHNGWSEANEAMVLERSIAFIKRYI